MRLLNITGPSEQTIKNPMNGPKRGSRKGRRPFQQTIGNVVGEILGVDVSCHERCWTCWHKSSSVPVKQDRDPPVLPGGDLNLVYFEEPPQPGNLVGLR